MWRYNELGRSMDRQCDFVTAGGASAAAAGSKCRKESVKKKTEREELERSPAGRKEKQQIFCKSDEAILVFHQKNIYSN